MKTSGLLILAIVGSLIFLNPANSADIGKEIIGKWTCASEWASGDIEIFQDGKIIWDNKEGAYNINNNILQVKFKPDPMAGISLTYTGTVDIQGDILMLNDGKGTPVKYKKVK